MKIARQAAAGSLESSDILVTLAPGDGGLELSLTSSVERYYGGAIRETMRRTLTELGVTSARVEAVDHGALDCVIAARVRCALYRAAEERYDWTREDGGQ